MPGVPAPLTRRTLLAGLVAAGTTAACTGSSAPPAPPPRPTVDQLARAAAVARERELSRLASAALGAYPAMTAARTALGFHAEHVRALSETLTPSPTATHSASGSVRVSASTGSPTTSASRTTGSRTATARSLAAALLEGADAHRSAAGGVSGDLARLLASIAASDSALAAVLRRVA
jgi:hypothetical protein